MRKLAGKGFFLTENGHFGICLGDISRNEIVIVPKEPSKYGEKLYTFPVVLTRERPRMKSERTLDGNGFSDDKFVDVDFIRRLSRYARRPRLSIRSAIHGPTPAPASPATANDNPHSNPPVYYNP